MPQPNLDLADTFYQSLTSGDITGCERLFAHDAVIWHNFTLTEQSPGDALAQAAALASLNAEFELTERVLLADGWLQQHRFHFPFADGSETLAAIQRVRVKDGLIARVDEYMDTGQLGRIGQKAQARSGV
jgi:ketosteroid isomerase-like protein